MKRLYFLFLLIPFSLFFQQSAKACVKPDSVAQVIVKYDTIWKGGCAYAHQIELRVTNIRLMNENPNKICSCALASYSSIFDSLNYVAFVDSGTSDPYQGFASFNKNPSSSSAWQNLHPGEGDWNGFVADVINSGLSSQDPVEMVIRATSTRSIAIDTGCVPYDSTLSRTIAQSSLGTDAWDSSAQDLVMSHNSVRSFDPSNQDSSWVTLEQKSSSYFTQLDSAILNNIPSSLTHYDQETSLRIFPNPAIDRLFIQMQKGELQRVEFLNMRGESLRMLQMEERTSGSTKTISLEKGLPSSGIVFVKFHTSKGLIGRKLLLQAE